MKAWTEMTPEERAAAARKGDAVLLMRPAPPCARQCHSVFDRTCASCLDWAVDNGVAFAREMAARDAAAPQPASDPLIVVERFLGLHCYRMTIRPRPDDPMCTGYMTEIDGVEVPPAIFFQAVQLEMAK